MPLTESQAHYLFGVMRLGPGARVALFNGQNGEWTAEVAEAAKKRGTLMCIEQAAPQHDPPDLWLLFAPIKKARTDFIVEKAAELGAARIVPSSPTPNVSGRTGFRPMRSRRPSNAGAPSCPKSPILWC